ncbi:MAG: GntR family transcriptional regulator [Sedimentisphaerales bacterium]|nr:GntR family transcriptional regulator [Sedimentisphaerales bacterium]
MLLEIDHHCGIPIYRQIIDRIRRQIMAGQIQEGRRLTSVRELAAQLRVNPMTVSKAYAMLESEGLLERRRGVGLFVAKLSSAYKDQKRQIILEEILKQVVVSAVQFGVSEKKIKEITSELYKKYKP